MLISLQIEEAFLNGYSNHVEPIWELRVLELLLGPPLGACNH